MKTNPETKVNNFLSKSNKDKKYLHIFLKNAKATYTDWWESKKMRMRKEMDKWKRWIPSNNFILQIAVVKGYREKRLDLNQ